MLRQSPFHERVSAANQTSLWSHWAGHLVVDKYQMSEKWEYVAIRNAVGVFDSSPLYKYRITGPDAERYLAGVLARDIRTCEPGQAQYTIWCDERGFVNEDGVVFRYGPDEFMLTAAEPNLAYFQDLVGYDKVEIEEISEQLGSLAVQGPRDHAGLHPHRLPAVAAARPGIRPPWRGPGVFRPSARYQRRRVLRSRTAVDRCLLLLPSPRRQHHPLVDHRRPLVALIPARMDPRRRSDQWCAPAVRVEPHPPGAAIQHRTARTA